MTSSAGQLMLGMVIAINAIARIMCLTDLIVGARFFTDISEKWSFVGRADIGGFDIGESADSTWSVAGLFFRDFGRKGNKKFVAGWRILDVDFDEGSGTSQFAFDVEQSGPVFGVNFKWGAGT